MKTLISFFEIPASDFKRAVKFYEAIFNVSLTAYEWETEKMAFFPEKEGETSGSISYTDGFIPSANGVLIHFEVDHMEDVLERVVQNQGKVIQPKTKIECEGRGYFSLFVDSEGNRLGLYSDR